jgi:hypothetical protein
VNGLSKSITIEVPMRTSAWPILPGTGPSTRPSSSPSNASSMNSMTRAVSLVMIHGVTVP